MGETLDLTLASAVKAFEAWENEYRENPDGFMTQEEQAAMEVASLSEGRAIYFMAILRKVGRAMDIANASKADPVLEMVREGLSYGTQEAEQLVDQINEAAERLTRLRANLRKVEDRCAALSAFIEQRKAA